MTAAAAAEPGAVLAAFADEEEDGLRMRAAAYAAALRRGAHIEATAAEHGALRLAARARTPGELAMQLTAFAVGGEATGVRVREAHARPTLAFAFAGQAQTRPGMGAGLYRANATFQTVLDRCSAPVERRYGIALGDVLYGARDPALLDDARFAQPALFALQAALLALWKGWGVRPDAVTGHSLGELGAACAAGAMTVDEGAELVAERGSLTQARVTAGAMAIAFAAPDRVREAVSTIGSVELAAINAPDVVAISGPHAAIERALAALDAHGVGATALGTTHPFHSSCTEPMLDELEQAAARIPRRPPRVPFASTLAGRLLADGEALDAGYWRRHAREPVRFVDAVRALSDAGMTLCIELGPHAVLTRLGARCAAGPARWLPSLRRGEDDRAVLLETAIELWLAGVELDLARAARELGGAAVSAAR